MKNESNFLDRNTILAVILVGLAWFAWQSYLNKKYPNMNQPPIQSQAEKMDSAKETQGTEKATVLANNTAFIKLNSQIELKEATIDITSENSQFLISNFGLGIKNYELKKYTQRDKSPIRFAQTESVFEMALIGRNQPLQFSIDKKESTILGKAQIGKMSIERTIIYDPSSYSFQNKVTVLNPDDSFQGIQVTIPEKIENYSSGSFFLPSYEHQEFVIFHNGKKEERMNITSTKENLNNSFPGVSTISLANQYFTAALNDQSEIIPEAQVITDQVNKIAKIILSYKTTTKKDRFEFQFTSYLGPKTQATLEKANPELTSVLNFGFFGSIGKILLSVLKWFYGFAGNWGFSIILLTILVRVLVLPFNIASYKSMKKMQRIQPMIQSLRERYKDDPTKLNQEMMVLMREQKVNPIGGCLPMLLQMPIFFALFQVLGNSIELYQAPFIFWIHDLSLKDPYYVLPILMGATLYVQHKITPTTMDPTQAKVMQFMPVIFSLMMVSLPSGLTLYTFVSTLFGILQQQYFTRDTRKATAITKEAKA